MTQDINASTPLRLKYPQLCFFPFNFIHLKKNRSAEVVAINKIYKNKIYHLAIFSLSAAIMSLFNYD